MKRFLSTIILAFSFNQYALADFGDADFPIGMFDDGPKSYHDAWCREIQQNCRIRFQGGAMWVEDQGGIDVSQYLLYRYEKEGGDHYNYLSYKSKSGKKKTALFLFRKNLAQRDFFKAIDRWKNQFAEPIPNYRLPNSQGPQNTQDRDGGLNPYQLK